MSAGDKVLSMDLQVQIGEQILYEIFPGKSEKDHPPVDISIGRQDSIHWFCRTKKFRVVAIHPAEPNLNARQPLFYRRFPEDNLEFAFHVNSGPARVDASVESIYKRSFSLTTAQCLIPIFVPAREVISRHAVPAACPLPQFPTCQ